MKKYTAFIIVLVSFLAVFSCQKEIEPDKPDTPITPDTPDPPTPTEQIIDYDKTSLGDLAELQGIKLGAAFTYWEYRNNPKVAEILTREFKAVTFGNEMKHDAIVQADGRMSFITADQMAQWAKDAGTELFGHVLGWHSQQQTTWLNTLIAQAGAGRTDFINPEAIDGGIDFESYPLGAGGDQLGWTQMNGPSYIRITDKYANSGSQSLLMDNSDGRCVDSWDVQAITPTFAVTPGKTYRIAWYARASRSADLQIDIREDGNAIAYKNSAWGNYGKMGKDTWTYQFVDYTVEAGKQLCVAFFGGTEAVTYYIDDFQIFPVEAAVDDDGPAREAIDGAFKSYVYGMVEHFDVYAWDVVNETFADGSGEFRNKYNTTGGFVWGSYYPSTKDWVDKAFEYATDACAKYGKKPILYLNDYNLETDAAKRRAYCRYVSGNPQVTGVGTQMHLDISTTDLKSKITACLKDLVATGRMVRISELDLKNHSEADQADIFKYIFQQYIEIVPKEQRGGITFWGINDKDSWVGENNEPLLWKGPNYDRKEAYKALYLYLCEVNGISPYKE